MIGEFASIFARQDFLNESAPPNALLHSNTMLRA